MKNPNVFNVGDKVRVVRIDTPLSGQRGIVTHINGEYHLVLVSVPLTERIIEAEYYRNEIEHLKD